MENTMKLDTSTWKKVKLGDICKKIESGNRLPKQNLVEGTVPYIMAKTTNNGIEAYIDENTLDYNGNRMKLFKGNCITFSIDNPDAIFYQPNKFFTSNIMRVIRIENFEKEHYVFLLEQLKKLAKGYDWGRKFSGPVVLNLELLFPVDKDGNINYTEIYKVGKALSTLDSLIEVGGGSIK